MFCYVNAFELKINPPSCSNCKWFIPDKHGLNEYGLCKMFKNKYEYEFDNKGNVIYDYAVHCRNTENMCGQNGFLFEPKHNNYELFKDLDEEYEEKDMTISDLLDEYDYINNRCCGEVNETDELDNIERDLMNIIKRLKKYYDNNTD